MKPLVRFAPISLVFALFACSSDPSSTADTGSNGAFDAGSGTDASAADAAAGNPDDPTCLPEMGESDACGGDPTGTWTYTAACSNENPFSGATSACQGATVSNMARTAGGTLTLGSDGTFTRTAHSEVTGTVTVPGGCASLPGNCASIALAIQTILRDTTAQCTQNAANGCDCAVTQTITVNDSGTYVKSGGTITANNGNVQNLYWYCAGSHTLKYRGVEGNPDQVAVVLTK